MFMLCAQELLEVYFSLSFSFRFCFDFDLGRFNFVHPLLMNDLFIVAPFFSSVHGSTFLLVDG